MPFSTLGWPYEDDELKAFLPSNVSVTGYEIILFGVARMVMMTTHFNVKVTCKDEYIHGLGHDNEGKNRVHTEEKAISHVEWNSCTAWEKLQ